MAKVNDRYPVFQIRRFLSFEDLVKACRQNGAVVPGRTEHFQVMDCTGAEPSMAQSLTIRQLEIFWSQRIY